MLRRLFTILSLISLLLCLITCAMWWRGRTGSEYVFVIRGCVGVSAVFQQGECTFKIVRYRAELSPELSMGFSLVEGKIAQDEDWFNLMPGDRLLRGWSDANYSGFAGFGAGVVEGHFNFTRVGGLSAG